MTFAAPAPPGPLAITVRQRSRRAIVSSFAGIAQRLLQMGSVLVIMPLMLHAMGKGGFGVWAAASSLAWMAVIVDVGIGQSLLTSVARAMARGDGEEIRRQVAAASMVSLVLAAIGAVLAVIVIPAIAPPTVADAYLIATLSLAINIPFSLAGNVWTGLQRFYVTSVWETAQTIATIIGLVALTRLSSDARLYVAVTIGALLAANIASTIHLVLAYPQLRPSFALASAGLGRALIRAGTPYLLLSLSLTLAVNLDSVIALTMLGPGDASRMAIAQRACLSAYGFLWVVTQPLWPAFAHAEARGDMAWVRRHVLGAALLVAACALTGGLVLVVFGQRLVALWMGDALRIGQDVFWAMFAWILILSLARVVDVLLTGLGAVWFQARTAIACSVLAFALKLALAPVLGVAGILGATACAYVAVCMPAYIWWVAKWLKQGRAVPDAACLSSNASGPIASAVLFEQIDLHAG